MIVDAHVHLERGLDGYDLHDARKNIIFNRISEYRRYGSQVEPHDATSLILDFRAELAFVVSESFSGRIQGLKIHSRLQRIDRAGYDEVADALTRVNDRLPIIVDAFYYGRDLACQPSLEGIVQLLERFPDRQFVIAHAGGYRLLEYFFHLREFDQVWFELSHSLQYLRDSSLFVDLQKMVRFTNKGRIVFGSDYPHASPRGQLDTLLEMCSALGVSPSDQERMISANAAELFHIDTDAGAPDQRSSRTT